MPHEILQDFSYQSGGMEKPVEIRAGSAFTIAERDVERLRREKKIGRFIDTERQRHAYTQWQPPPGRHAQVAALKRQAAEVARQEAALARKAAARPGRRKR